MLKIVKHPWYLHCLKNLKINWKTEWGDLLVCVHPLIAGDEFHLDLGRGLQRRSLKKIPRSDPRQKNLQRTRASVSLKKNQLQFTICSRCRSFLKLISIQIFIEPNVWFWGFESLLLSFGEITMPGSSEIQDTEK